MTQKLNQVLVDLAKTLPDEVECDFHIVIGLKGDLSKGLSKDSTISTDIPDKEDVLRVLYNLTHYLADEQKLSHKQLKGPVIQ